MGGTLSTSSTAGSTNGSAGGMTSMGASRIDASELSEEERLSLPIMSAEDVARVSVPIAKLLEAEAGDGEGAGAQLVRDLMDEHGFLIVTDVLSGGEIAELQASFERDFRCALPDNIDKTKDPLHVETYPDLIEGHFSGTMMASFGLPHSELSWRCRIHPNVRRVYQALFPGEELCSSLDNLFFTQRGTPGTTVNRRWPHADTNKRHSKCGALECYQGVVYVWSSEDEDSSTTVIMPKSHRDVFDTIMEDRNFASGRRLYAEICDMANKEAADALMDRFLKEARRVPVPAGALLVWSSKTVHQGWGGGKRLAQTVCWEPKVRRERKVLVTKAKLALMGIPTTHWASLGLPQIASGRFSRTPRLTDSGWHWIPSYAIRQGGDVVEYTHEAFLDLVKCASEEMEESDPATQELLALLRPEIAEVL